MAKGNGLGMACYVGGYDLSNDVGAITNATLERALLDATGIDKSAMERLPGLYTSSIGFTGFFNDAAAQEHVALKALPTADVIVSILKGTTLGDVGAGLRAKQVGYGWTRGAGGAFGPPAGAGTAGSGASSLGAGASLSGLVAFPVF